MKLLLLLLSLIILTHCLYAQKDIKALSYDDIDSCAMVYIQKREYTKGIPYILAAREKARLEFGKLDSVYAEYTGELGYYYYLSNLYKKSESFFREAKTIFAKVLGKEHPLYTTNLNNLAILYNKMGLYPQSERLFLENKKIRAKVLGKEHIDYAVIINNLALLYSKMGLYPQAERLFLETKKIRAKVLGKEHPSYSVALNNLALLYLDMGRYTQAEPLFLETKKIRAKVLGKEHPSYATILGNLALLYLDIGRYAQAEPLYLESIKINAKVLGKDSPGYATCLNNLGYMYKKMGSYSQAEPLYLEAKKIRAKVLGTEHPRYATSLNNLAVLYKKMGLYSEAEPLYLESIKIKAKVLGKEHPSYAININNLANLYKIMGDYPQAEYLYLESKKIRAKVLGKEHPYYAMILSNLAGLYQKMGKYAQAELLYLESINIDAKVLGKEHPSYAQGLNNLAGLYYETGNLDSAFTYCMASLNANSADINSNFVDTETLDEFDYYSYQQLGSSLNRLLYILKAQYKKNNDIAKLKQHFKVVQTAMRINERIRNNFSSEGDKLRTLRMNSEFVRQGMETVVLLEKETYIKEGFTFAEQNKSILLADAVKGNRARFLGDLPDSLAHKESRFQKKITQLKKQRFNAKTEKKKEELNKALGELNLEINVFLKSLKNKYPRYHALKYENITAKAKDIQVLLDDKTALLEYFLTDSICYLFLVSSKEVQLYPIEIKLDEINKRIKKLRYALSDYEFILTEKRKAYELFTTTAYWFYQNLLSIALDKHDFENLVIVTDGEFGHLPFEAFLIEPAEEQKINYNQLHYLVTDYNISYSYSATLWKESLNTINQNNNGKMLACAASYPMVDSNLLSIRLPYYYNLRSILIPLPAAQKEINTISKQFQGDFLQNDLTNEKFFKENAKKYAIIHLAMHGILDTKRPMMSSLAFTENRDSTEDNFLHAYEISNMKLNANLVVLSACETGYGKFEQGEGIVSIARSFMYAGVPSLVVSLWQVNDVSTAKIMNSFYLNLSDGMNKATALRLAKLDYLKNTKGITAHPAFWSPFIQLGDSRPIYIKTKGSWLPWGIGAFVIIFAGGYFLLRRRKVLV